MIKQSAPPATWTASPDPSLQVNSVAIDANGNRCVFGTSNEYGTGKFAIYCYDSTGKKLWDCPVSDEEISQGVFWVSISSDGNFVAAGGKEAPVSGKSNGFLIACCGTTGDVLLKVHTPYRVNQVSLDNQGVWLAAVYGSTLELYKRDETTNKFSLIDKKDVHPYSLNSCEIAGNGSRVVASGRIYDDAARPLRESEVPGAVFSYAVSDNGLTNVQPCFLNQASMRVAIVNSGAVWGASLHDGSCLMLTTKQSQTPVWRLKPDNIPMSLAYGFAITETEQGEIVCACGANGLDESGGYLYTVHVPHADNVQKDTKVSWCQKLSFGANPGVTLDINARYVTGTDGTPDKISKNESAGYFYLFEGATGSKQWQYGTSLMNWPMMLSADGKSVFAGSDNGSVYYWRLDK